MLGHRGLPLGQLLIAAIEAQAQGETHRAADREARDGIMGQGIGPVAVVVVPVHVVKQAPHVFAQGIVKHHQRFAAAMPMGFRLLEHAAEPRRLTASSRQGASERKRERFVLSALSRMQRAILAMLLLGKTISPVR